MDRVVLFIRKVFAMDERGVTPPQSGIEPKAKKDLSIILAVGMAIVLFGAVVAFLGLF
jgi:hypothetical protein